MQSHPKRHNVQDTFPRVRKRKERKSGSTKRGGVKSPNCKPRDAHSKGVLCKKGKGNNGMCHPSILEDLTTRLSGKKKKVGERQGIPSNLDGTGKRTDKPLVQQKKGDVAYLFLPGEKNERFKPGRVTSKGNDVKKRYCATSCSYLVKREKKRKMIEYRATWDRGGKRSHWCTDG